MDDLYRYNNVLYQSKDNLYQNKDDPYKCRDILGVFSNLCPQSARDKYRYPTDLGNTQAQEQRNS
ncbi:MAG: hypothetical protein HXX16_10340 [Bacteroidales bacterium]|nr:hypothetical protein [Bacteroidales bacterium]